MPHNIDLILTLTAGLTVALILGFITQQLRLSPIVGYLLAGILVGPFTPGFVANQDIAMQFAEIGIILLMFGEGLHFHLKDLLSVKKIAIPGAIIQIATATLLGAGLTRFFGWTWSAGFIFGMAISVASTVVLTRVLSDNRNLHTPTGHIAVGWLIVEDLFTILALVMLPALFASAETSNAEIWKSLGIALLKLAALIAFALIVGQRIIPLFLGYVARSRSRELFTLTVLTLALGIAVGSAKLFGASMALGAFLAGMIVGQSEYGARAASEALPMRDAFAVLFFVSVGILFEPASVAQGWPLMLATLGIVLIGKPLAALLVVLAMGRSFRSALSISVALAQIGEFSFILSALALSMGLLPPEANNILVVVSILSITLNPLLYKTIDPLLKWLESKGWIRAKKLPQLDEIPQLDKEVHHAVVIGYGPIGKTLVRILSNTGIQSIIIEMNIDTVKTLLKDGHTVLYGDASKRDILESAGIENARALIISASDLPTKEIVEAARELNPNIRILARCIYLREQEALKHAGADAIFSSEGEVALAMTEFIMRSLRATDEQIDKERSHIREELLS